MKFPRLPIGLEKLLASGDIIKKFPGVVIFSAYIPSQQDAFNAGLMNLFKFRLLYPFTQVLFFSFHSKEALLKTDRFGVLDLDGTEFIQLPCAYNIMITAVEKCTKKMEHHPVGWLQFSENAGTEMITKAIHELKHGEKLDIGNLVLNPMRASALAVSLMPELKEKYQDVFERNHAELISFIGSPEIFELLQLANNFGKSKNPFLEHAFLFSQQLIALAKNPSYTKPKKIVSQIDQINSSLNILIHLYDGARRT